jgi:hypothetical protein
MKPKTKRDGAHVEDGITKCNTSKTTTSMADTNKYSKDTENYTEKQTLNKVRNWITKAYPKIGRKTFLLC